MMKRLLITVCLCAGVYSAPDTLRQAIDTGNAEPAYKVFYENGFYREAIELLRAKIAERPDTVNPDYCTYLAFCYIASGRQDSAIDIFITLLNSDSAFYLDTVTTSPKIIQVFTDSRTQWRDRKAMPDQPSSPTEATGEKPTDTAVPQSVTRDTVPASVLLQPAEPRPMDWGGYAIACAPGGAGQFYHHRPVHGGVFLALQVIGLAVGYWAFNKRDDFYDSQYGWGDWNRHEYERYSDFSKAGFCIFIGAYIVSTAECIIHIRATSHH
jgi:tetratricopeptide (TPR) repeat protein